MDKFTSLFIFLGGNIPTLLFAFNVLDRYSQLKLKINSTKIKYSINMPVLNVSIGKSCMMSLLKPNSLLIVIFSINLSLT